MLRICSSLNQIIESNFPMVGKDWPLPCEMPVIDDQTEQSSYSFGIKIQI